MKDLAALERTAKGFANRTRIATLHLLERWPNLALHHIAERLHVNMKTAHEHVRRLTLAGLVTKQYRGTAVSHSVTPLGRVVLAFLRKIDKG